MWYFPFKNGFFFIGGKLKFTGLFPGSYDLSISDGSKWCWESSTQRIEITEITNNAAPFRRVGISVPIFSSHNTKVLNYWRKKYFYVVILQKCVLFLCGKGSVRVIAKYDF